MVVDREVEKFGEKLAVAHRAQMKSLHSMTMLLQREDQKVWEGQVLRHPHYYLIAFLASQSLGKPCIHATDSRKCFLWTPVLHSREFVIATEKLRLCCCLGH